MVYLFKDGCNLWMVAPSDEYARSKESSTTWQAPDGEIYSSMFLDFDTEEETYEHLVATKTAIKFLLDTEVEVIKL